MKTCIFLCLTVLAVSMTQARVTYGQLLQLAKTANDDIKADFEIQLDELDNVVDFQSMLKQMGHEFNFEESNEEEMENMIEQLNGFGRIMITDGTNANLDDNLKAGECACGEKACACCCIGTFIYKGKKYYITLCTRITQTGSAFFVELFLQQQKVQSAYVSRPVDLSYTVSSYLKVGIKIYYVSINKICFHLYFVVNGTTYKCKSHCLTLPASRLGLNLAKSGE